jgi:hypothetical protein
MRFPLSQALRAAAIVAAVVAALGSATGQDRPRHPDRERDDLAGPVKSVTIAVALPSNPGHPQPTESSTYSEAGWLLERTSYADGRAAGTVRFADEKDVRRASASTPAGMGYGVRPTRLQPRDVAEPPKPAADGTYPFVVSRVFDTAGRLLVDSVTPGVDPKTAAPLARITYRYDASGRVSERARYYLQYGTPVEREVFVYDEHDHVAESLVYRQGNALAAKRAHAYEYDERGNWTKRTTTETLGGAATVTVTTRTITYY